MRLTEIKTVRKSFFRRIFSKTKTKDIEIREIKITKVKVFDNQITIHHKDVTPGTKLKLNLTGKELEIQN